MAKARTTKPNTFIRDWRKHRGLTCQDIADRTGLTQGAISHVERGARGYRQATLEAIARALGCTPVDLLTGPPAATTCPIFIREWRLHRGLTLQDVADKTGITHATIGRVERGKIAYTRDTIEAIADAMNCLPGQLLSYPPNGAPSGEQVASLVLEAMHGLLHDIDKLFPKSSARRAAGAK